MLRVLKKPQSLCTFASLRLRENVYRFRIVIQCITTQKYGITDDISQMLLDFAIVGEEGKKGNYGMKQKQLDARFSKEHDRESHTAKRIEEYNQSHTVQSALHRQALL